MFIIYFASIFLLNYFVYSKSFESNTGHYNNYTVFRLKANTNSQLDYLLKLSQRDNEIDFWTYPASLNSTVDVMIPPNLKDKYEISFSENNLLKSILIEDVEKLITKQRQESVKTTDSGFKREIIPGFWSAYQRLSLIFEFLGEVEKAYPQIASVEIIGKSNENRDIRIIKIGIHDSQSRNDKPIIFLDSAIHAREWITAAVTTYFIQQLVDGFEQNDAEIIALLTKFDFYILPVFNPDGYEYTHTNQRLWRKTRAATSGSTCIGTDANRNFDYKWMVAGASSDPCSETFAGSEAGNQPETKVFTDYILANRQNIKAYFAVHSYSQLLLYPWGWTLDLPPDNDKLLDRAGIAVSELTSYYGTRYTYGSSSNVLYFASGNAVDWSYEVAGVRYAYTIELRDTGTYGFLLPVDQIIATSIETTAAFRAFAKAIATEF